MRKRIVVLTLAAFIAAVGFAATFQPRVQAQDEMTPHVCDSTLILLLYIAEHDYGFESMMDLSTFEKGQFKPLFEAMMSADDMMGDDDMGSEDDMTGDEDDMTGDEDDMTGDDDDMMVALLPGHVEGEDMVCTALREEVESFLTAAIKDSMMME